MNIYKCEYPKSVEGSVRISEDATLNIPEIEISYGTSMNSKLERKVDYIVVTFPSRFDQKTSRITFDNDRIFVDYNSSKELYSITFNSIESLIDVKTNIPTQSSEIEEHAAAHMDIEIMIFIQAALQAWGMVTDSLQFIDMFGSLTLTTIQALEEAGQGPEDPPETPPEEPPKQDP